MKLPPPARLLRHRGPALLLATVDAFDGDRLVCGSNGGGPWPWPRLLEGAAQTAGLLAGLQAGGPGKTAVIAQYRDVVIHADAHDGAIRFHARLDRRVLHFWRCAVEARAAAGDLLLEGLVTIAPPGSPR
jgi:hypothetical protein